MVLLSLTPYSRPELASFCPVMGAGTSATACFCYSLYLWLNPSWLERLWRPKKSKYKMGWAYVKSINLTLLKHVFHTPKGAPNVTRMQVVMKTVQKLECPGNSELLCPQLWKIWMERTQSPNPQNPRLLVYKMGHNMGWYLSQNCVCAWHDTKHL